MSSAPIPMHPEESGDDGHVEKAISMPRWWVEDLPYWATAAVLHLVLLLLLTTLEVKEKSAPHEPGESPEVSLVVRKRAPARLRAPPREVHTPLPDLNVRPAITFEAPELETESLVRPETNRESLVKWYDPALLTPAIGLRGPSGPALYGERRGKRSLVQGGGGGATEGAVQAALQWLWRHQSDDGSWSARGFIRQCRETCRNENPERYGDGRGVGEYEAGVTGLALLAFAGNGYTHRRGARPEFVRCVARGVEYLKSVQVRSSDRTTNGRYSVTSRPMWVYEHAIATMAMAELLAISGDRHSLEKSVRDAVELCLGAQNDEVGTRGWRYGYKPGDNDVSVIGWMVLALKTASLAGLDDLSDRIEDSLEGALDYIHRATDRTTGRTSYHHTHWGDNRAHDLDRDIFSTDLSCMTSVGVLCRLLTGAKRSHSMVRKGVRILTAHPPQWQEQDGSGRSTINFYYWYYGSYALFQFGGKEWDTWNAHMKAALLPSQRSGNGCEAGSWDPLGAWGYRGGRVYATALGTMILEVYYRYRSVEAAALPQDP